METKMTVYELIVFESIEYNTVITTQIFANKAKAMKAYNEEVEKAKKGAKENLDEDEISYNECSDCYDIYKNGYASEWEVEISIKEMNVIE